MSEEVWAHTLALGDYYQVSSYGRVRSINRKVVHKDGKVTRHKSKVLKQGLNKKGYYVVWPSFYGKKKSLVVHRLVATAFHGNPSEFDQVNHIDENKTNNRVENLEWCDAAYNVEYSQASSGWFTSPKGELVFINNFARFSRDNGLSYGKLSALKSGERLTHKGWRYAGKS